VNKTTAQNISSCQQRLDNVAARLLQAAAKRGPAAEPIKLLAVSKTFPAQAVIDFVHCGQLRFGENYVQEACEKIIQCRNLLADEDNHAELEWHFIGPLQSNKTKQVAEHFDWVQSVDRLKIAQRLSEQRPTHLQPLNVCIQVNVSGEASKSGCSVQEALTLAARIMTFPNLRLRGLMAIPEAIIQIDEKNSNLPSLESQFIQMQKLFKQLKELAAETCKNQIRPASADPAMAPETIKENALIDTLSLGMSSDLELAVAAGSTMVRIGSALFGDRSARA
jgi:PLP dependent protein